MSYIKMSVASIFGRPKSMFYFKRNWITSQIYASCTA